VALLYHRRELRQKRTVRLPSRDARELRPKGKVRLPAGGQLGQERREIGIPRKACGAERRWTARFVARERLAQKRYRLPILGLGERTQTAPVEFSRPASTAKEHGRRLAE
jgi:hypothetical protein